MTALSSRRLSQLGFVLGLGAGALAFVAGGYHEVAFVCFVITWYAFGYGVTRGRLHPDHRVPWLVHILLFPVAWVVGLALFWARLGNELAAVLLGATVAVALQALLTNLVLRDVRADQRHDLRHRLGLE